MCIRKFVVLFSNCNRNISIQSQLQILMFNIDILYTNIFSVFQTLTSALVRDLLYFWIILKHLQKLQMSVLNGALKGSQSDGQQVYYCRMICWLYPHVKSMSDIHYGGHASIVFLHTIITIGKNETACDTSSPVKRKQNVLTYSSYVKTASYPNHVLEGSLKQYWPVKMWLEAIPPETEVPQRMWLSKVWT